MQYRRRVLRVIRSKKKSLIAGVVALIVLLSIVAVRSSLNRDPEISSETAISPTYNTVDEAYNQIVSDFEFSLNKYLEICKAGQDFLNPTTSIINTRFTLINSLVTIHLINGSLPDPSIIDEFNYTSGVIKTDVFISHIIGNFLSLFYLTNNKTMLDTAVKLFLKMPNVFTEEHFFKERLMTRAQNTFTFDGGFTLNGHLESNIQSEFIGLSYPTDRAWFAEFAIKSLSTVARSLVNGTVSLEINAFTGGWSSTERSSEFNGASFFWTLKNIVTQTNNTLTYAGELFAKSLPYLVKMKGLSFLPGLVAIDNITLADELLNRAINDEYVNYNGLFYSLYTCYSLTGDSKYKKMAYRAYTKFRKDHWSEYGFNNGQDADIFSTIKYLVLMFKDVTVFKPNDWIFTSAGCPLRNLGTLNPKLNDLLMDYRYSIREDFGDWYIPDIDGERR